MLFKECDNIRFRIPRVKYIHMRITSRLFNIRFEPLESQEERTTYIPWMLINVISDLYICYQMTDQW